MEEQMVDLPPILAKRVMVFDKHHYLRVKYIEPYVQHRITDERNRILGVAESIKSTATLEPDGDASKVTNYMAGRQEGWNAALAKLADEVGKGN